MENFECLPNVVRARDNFSIYINKFSPKHWHTTIILRNDNGTFFYVQTLIHLTLIKTHHIGRRRARCNWIKLIQSLSRNGHMHYWKMTYVRFLSQSYNDHFAPAMSNIPISEWHTLIRDQSYEWFSYRIWKLLIFFTIP